MVYGGRQILLSVYLILPELRKICSPATLSKVRLELQIKDTTIYIVKYNYCLILTSLVNTVNILATLIVVSYLNDVHTSVCNANKYV